MAKSEFGKGLTYCLGLFLAHTQDHRLEDEGVDKVVPGLSVKLWFYGAGDHLFDFEIPATLPKSLQVRLKKFQIKVLDWRLPMGDDKQATEQDKQWAIQEATELLRLIDKHYGIASVKGEWQ